jgi:hypothetical protein
MSRVRGFEDLIAWQRARALTGQIYEITRRGHLARFLALQDNFKEQRLSKQD